jgi:hypothetical protein
MERPFPHHETYSVDGDFDAMNRVFQLRRWRFVFLDFKPGCGEFARAREASLA